MRPSWRILVGRGPTAAAAIAMLVLACSSQPDRDTASGGAGRLAYLMRDFRRTEAGCIAPGSRECARILLEYPDFVEAPSPEVAASINGQVRSWILAPLIEETPANSVEDLMDRFLSRYREYKADFPDAPVVWFAERRVKVVNLSITCLSLKSEESTFTGGAHSNTWIVYSNFRPATGERIALEDLIRPGTIDRLTAIAEDRFRTVRELDPDEPLDAAGFWFEGGRFALNDNFSIGTAGLTFLFNQYEIAPFALGPTEIVLPWSEISDLLRPDAGIR